MQNRTAIIAGIAVVALVAILAVGAVGLLAFNLFLGQTQAPSAPLTSVPVDTATESAGQPSDLTVFEISPEQSQVSFSIFEELGGQPNTVIGTTSDVAGQVALDMSDLSKTEIGVIQVNARTFVTDNNNRNRMIQNRILETGQYELITFTPTAVTGLSGAAQPGQSVAFQIEGDLTIRDVTKHVIFDATVQGDSETKLTGQATTTITRTDYNLKVPSVPNVANVGEEVTLEINFVAEAAG